ncbi:molybdate ABC transporter substrate-binding protein, partial [Cronobacter sakazakii]
MAQLWLKLALGVTLSAGAVGASLAQDNTVTVFAAASLTNALQDIAKDYAKGHQVKVVSSFASSSTLARQIEAGAPADIFISAD